MKITVKLEWSEIQKILANHINRNFDDERVQPEEIHFDQINHAVTITLKEP